MSDKDTCFEAKFDGNPCTYFNPRHIGGPYFDRF